MPAFKSKYAISSSYHHGDLANELKKQALIIAKKKGLAHLNLRSLAKQCGVSATAVYRHFESKDHLLAILAEEGLDELQKMMMKEEDPHRLQKMGIAYIRYSLRDPLRFQLILATSAEQSRFPSLLNKNTQTYEVVKSEVKKCVENGTMVGNVNLLTSTAWSTVHGVAMLLLDNHLLRTKTLEDKIKLALGIMTVVGRGLTRVDGI